MWARLPTLASAPGAFAVKSARRALSNFHPLAQHVSKPGNTIETPFDFSAENHLRAEHILGKQARRAETTGPGFVFDTAASRSLRRTGRGDAAAATWIVRGDGSRRRARSVEMGRGDAEVR